MYSEILHHVGWQQFINRHRITCRTSALSQLKFRGNLITRNLCCNKCPTSGRCRSYHLVEGKCKAVKFSLEEPMKSLRRVQVQLYSVFNSALEWGGCLTAGPGRSTPGKEPKTHFIGGWVGPRAVLDGC